MQQKAFAKLNLTLGITGQRVDGYHLLDTVFCPINLYDTLSICTKPGDGILLTCTHAGLANGENLVLRAAHLFSQETGLPLSLHFHLIKRIPVQSGLGGGSADAAAALGLLKGLFPGAANDGALFDMALSLGADVPYALMGGIRRAGGIGECLTPLFGVPDLYFVILKPEAGLSTPDVFHAYDNMTPVAQPDVDGAVFALANGDLQAFANFSGNALQSAAQTLCPPIETLCTALLDHGALYAAMTGTGSAVFGLFPGKERALSAADSLKGLAPFCAFAQSVF